MSSTTNGTAPEGANSTSSNNVITRKPSVRTFLVSVPGDKKPPKHHKHGAIKELPQTLNLEEVQQHIEHVEQMVQVVNNVTIECSNCLKIAKSCTKKA